MENLSGRLTLFHNLYLGCLIGMFICLVIAVILFFRLDIRNVIAFLTGHEAKREIRNIEQSSKVKNQKEAVPEKSEYETPSGNIAFRKVEGIAGITITKRLEDGTEQTTEILPVMSSDEKTTLLKQELPDFHIEREILMIHTEEIIA